MKTMIRSTQWIVLHLSTLQVILFLIVVFMLLGVVSAIYPASISTDGLFRSAVLAGMLELLLLGIRNQADEKGPTQFRGEILLSTDKLYERLGSLIQSSKISTAYVLGYSLGRWTDLVKWLSETHKIETHVMCHDPNNAISPEERTKLETNLKEMKNRYVPHSLVHLWTTPNRPTLRAIVLLSEQSAEIAQGNPICAALGWYNYRDSDSKVGGIAPIRMLFFDSLQGPAEQMVAQAALGEFRRLFTEPTAREFDG